jgi:Suppressor of fused protein (SUFU)
MDIQTYKKQFNEGDSVGWDAIDAHLEQLYGTQQPKHFAPPLHYQLGGEDPLDGISIYQSASHSPHHHFVSYGFSELYYDEESAGGEFSKFGFELSFRLAPFSGDSELPTWPVALMQNLAKYVFKSKNWFEEFHFIPALGPIRLETDTEITAIAFALDPELGKITTPHGELAFLQMVGITSAEYAVLKEANSTIETEKLIQKLRVQNPYLITDLTRR